MRLFLTVPTAGHYSTQMVVGPGGTSIAVIITDHHANRLYFYELKGKALSLVGSFDLTKAGQPEIPGKFIERTPTTMPKPESGASSVEEH
jgi:hypothetical protein